MTNYIRKKISKYFTGESEIIFNNNTPTTEQLVNKFDEISEIGLYLHIPFCEKICPYCPYNKEVYTNELGTAYIKALKYEIDTYSSILKNKPITSFYIGGGTPSIMLGKGIDEIITHVYKSFNMQCKPHMESHPNHLTLENLNIIESLGIKYLSVGLESLQDKHLKMLQRPYTVSEAKKNIERAINKNFECVNVDYIFDLPEQTKQEIEQAAKDMVQLGIHQAATYPLFRFPYTRLGKDFNYTKNALNTMFRRRKFLKIFENIFYNSGFRRSSVWAFTQTGIDKYCSVTVPMYLGLGASGSSYLKDIFYVNTFKVKEYINKIREEKMPISLSINLTKKMQMSGWLYWRLYETHFNKADFEKRFNIEFDLEYNRIIKFWDLLGFLNNGQDYIKLTDKGSYWIHAFEDFFSINYINKLWGTSKVNAWPEQVIL